MGMPSSNPHETAEFSHKPRDTLWVLYQCHYRMGFAPPGEAVATLRNKCVATVADPYKELVVLSTQPGTRRFTPRPRFLSKPHGRRVVDPVELRVRGRRDKRTNGWLVQFPGDFSFDQPLHANEGFGVIGIDHHCVGGVMVRKKSISGAITVSVATMTVPDKATTDATVNASAVTGLESRVCSHGRCR